MKKFIVVAVALLVLTLPSTADSYGVIQLFGIVPEFVNISVASSQIALNLKSITQTPIAVSSIRVWSSRHWSIAIQSKNDGFLKNSIDPSERIGYLFTLGSLTTSPESLSMVWTSSVQEPTLKVGFELPLKVQVLPLNTSLATGIYEDSLTINIQQL